MYAFSGSNYLSVYCILVKLCDAGWDLVKKWRLAKCLCLCLCCMEFLEKVFYASWALVKPQTSKMSPPMCTAWWSQYTEDKKAQQDQSSYLSISCSYGNMRHMFALTIQTLCRWSIIKTKPCWRHMLVTIHHTIPQLLTSMYKVFFVQKGSMLAKKDFFCTCWTCQLVSDSALHKGVSIWRI